MQKNNSLEQEGVCRRSPHPFYMKSCKVTCSCSARIFTLSPWREGWVGSVTVRVDRTPNHGIFQFYTSLLSCFSSAIFFLHINRATVVSECLKVPVFNRHTTFLLLLWVQSLKIPTWRKIVAPSFPEHTK